MNEKFNEAIAIVKSQPGHWEMLQCFPVKTLLKAISAWPACFKRWREPDKDWLSMDLRNPERSKAKWVWDGAQFDEKKLFLEIGGSYGDVIAKMAAAYAIYPDGTTNKNFGSFINSILKKG